MRVLHDIQKWFLKLKPISNTHQVIEFNKFGFRSNANNDFLVFKISEAEVYTDHSVHRFGSYLIFKFI